MSDANAASHHGEIIIVRRKSHGDHGHHGGAWKIAYADFVTAMMAFFLVMWLINAANEKTRAQVASYFNPVKLTDTATSKKGLNEPVKTSPAEDAKEKSTPIDEKNSQTGQAKPEKEQKERQPEQGKFTEEQLFKNPYGVLAQLAGQAIEGAPAGHSEKGLAIVEIAEPGHRGGDAYRDPFDPLAWKKASEPSNAIADVQANIEPEESPLAATKPVEKTSLGPAEMQKPAPQPSPALKPIIPDVKAVAPEPLKKMETAKAPASVNEPKTEAVSEQAAVAIRKRLMENLKQVNPDLKPTLEVKQTKEGVLISLTDSLSFDMFSVGSAVPQPQLVLLMEKVAATLHNYGGKIIIRGHTDARRFRNRDNDNWRLSTARAQMAYYMLVRAGINENSVERIEGYADRDLKYPDEPESAGNRRIEILLKVEGP
jgi:chemotaxis protein MotB